MKEGSELPAFTQQTYSNNRMLQNSVYVVYGIQAQQKHSNHHSLPHDHYRDEIILQ